MVKATITSKGQVTIPKRVRDDLGLVTGDHIGFVADGRGSYKLKPIRTRSSAQGVCDRLVKPGVHANIEDMKDAVKDSVAERFRRAVRRSRRR
jgi:antitoxin PrlF